MALALLSAVPAFAEPPAASVTCVEPARYERLARITDGNLGRIAYFLARPQSPHPPDGACRAVVLKGAIGRGSTRALLEAIDKNRGWLAAVYIAVTDGDLAEELQLADALRLFKLEAVLMRTDIHYEPDFIFVPTRLPPSRSYSGTDPNLDPPTPLAASLADWRRNTERLISAGGSICGAACWTVLSGGIDRLVIWNPGRLPKDAAQIAAQPETAEPARTRAAARRALGLNGVLNSGPNGLSLSSGISRSPPEIHQAIGKVCHVRLDYADNLLVEVARDVTALAKRDFPYQRLKALSERVKQVDGASSNLLLCTVAVREHARMRAYKELCVAGCANAEVMRTLATFAASQMKGDANAKAAPQK